MKLGKAMNIAADCVFSDIFGRQTKHREAAECEAFATQEQTLEMDVSLGGG